MFREQVKYKDVIRYGKITIGNNCFIGLNTTILPGVKIGSNVIVGACSLVNTDIPDGCVYAGVPAKFICKTEEYAEKCLKETPTYDKDYYKINKRDALLNMFLK